MTGLPASVGNVIAKPAMTFLLLTIGSAGDVHPFVAIGEELARRGHDVRLITNPAFAHLVNDAGAAAGRLTFVPLGTVADFDTIKADPDLWHRTRALKAVFGMVTATLRRTYDTLAAQVVPGKTVVVASSLAFAARCAQEVLELPTATVHLAPALFRSVIVPPKLPGLFLPEWLPQRIKRAIFEGGDRYVLDRFLGPPLNAFRAELGLGPVSGIMDTWWNSPQRVVGLFPDWYGPPQTDWPPQTRLTGFLRFDEPGELPAELSTFLDAGEPPIAFTPGSAMHHGQRFFAAAVDACRRLNRRGLLLSRHSAHLPATLPASVLHVPYAPFGRLFSRVAAVCHHGGIGTVAQALAAGVPQVICPFAHDQLDNAARLQRLGVGGVVSSRRPRFSPPLRRLLGDPAVADRCRTLAGRVRADRPLGPTCDLLESLTRAGG